MTSRDRYFRELWEGKRSGTGDKFLVALLIPCAFLYGAVLRLRAFLYARGILASHRLAAPVVSVGNLSVGGTGKTPMALYLARLFIDRGKRVVLLSRGYGGAGGDTVRVVSDGARLLLSPSEAGDEPVLLARSVPGLVVVTGSDRYRAGLEALDRFKPDIFLLDDGYQHLRLERDINILLLDAVRPFGNGWTLPAGLLREPLSAVRRADFIVWTRAEGDVPPLEFAGIPAFRSKHALSGFVPLSGGTPTPFAALRDKKGVACAGIADPESFFRGLVGEGLVLSATLAFRDHCRYGDEELAAIREALALHGANYLITTEKDAVKLADCHDFSVAAYAALLDLEIADAVRFEAALEKLL